MISIRLSLFLLLALTSRALAHECTAPDAALADALSDNWRTWPSIFHAYDRYRGCDDGAIAEGFSDSIVHLLASRWNTLPQAQTLISRRPAFRGFIVQHIDATTDPDELKAVFHAATTNCPASATKLCKQIAIAAKDALIEAEAVAP